MDYEMHITYEDDIKQLEVGDLVEFKKSRRPYTHWGIYTGNGEVIHLTGDNGHSSKLNASVLKTELMKVPAKKRKKNNVKDKSLGLPGTTDDILSRAHALEGLTFYDLLYFNCEHFATYCRYGGGYSSQANNFFKFWSYVPFIGKIVNAARKREMERVFKTLDTAVSDHQLGRK